MNNIYLNKSLSELVALGKAWIVKEKNGEVFAFSAKPAFISGSWFSPLKNDKVRIGNSKKTDYLRNTFAKHNDAYSPISLLGLVDEQEIDTADTIDCEFTQTFSQLNRLQKFYNIIASTDKLGEFVAEGSRTSDVLYLPSLKVDGAINLQRFCYDNNKLMSYLGVSKPIKIGDQRSSSKKVKSLDNLFDDFIDNAEEKE